MFPNPPAPGEDFSFLKLRNPRNTTKEFMRKAAKLGFRGLRLHDLRGTHETLLLDAGVPVQVVAARCGHDPCRPAAELCQEDAQGGHISGGRQRRIIPRNPWGLAMRAERAANKAGRIR
jgi:hypothetical protein